MLLQSWLPFDAIGAESLRERGASSALPPLYFLHVWWARRPLTISRAAVLASLLPDWETLAARVPPETLGFPSEAAYRAWFLRLLGIRGDPAAVRRLLQWARETGRNLGPNPYNAPRAFTVNPSPDDLALLEKLLGLVWGEGTSLRDIVILDPFAGGGSIPFEALRYGLSVMANELNPVAAVILQATLVYPARFGPDLTADIREWGKKWARRVNERLGRFFPKGAGENIFAYLWARTVPCPVTGRPVPLSPNWWLSRNPPVAVRLRADPAWDEPRFEIYTPQGKDDPDQGTVSGGIARSPWTGETIDGNYIKTQAQAGRMGQMLYAVALKRPGGFDFRVPTPEDVEAARAAEAELARLRPRWEAENLIPTEPIPEGLKTAEPMRYGMQTWADMFSPRQLLALGTFVETLRDLRAELRAALAPDRAAAVETYLAIALDKASIYNNRACRFDPTRGIRSVFDRHDFAFVWSHGEFDASANLLPWCIDQVADAYQDMARLLAPAPPASALAPAPTPAQDGPRDPRPAVVILQGNAADLSAVPDRSVHAVVTDPPYYDNVMYAELSDFFYVWLRRTVGHLHPEWFASPLTDKDAEAVANPARFRGVEAGQARALAERDYERKMTAAFREIARVLRDDGVLTVMFTHKKVEAWDALATALIEAGFTVESSWPVHTESEHSLHQAKKNAARSTILLCCRKRVGEHLSSAPLPLGSSAPPLPGPSAPPPPGPSAPPPPSSPAPTWWDDLVPEVRRVAREKAEAFARQGITGVDLYLSVFGPVLSVISRRWPVWTREVDERTGAPKVLRPETALDLARQEVVRLRKRGLLGGREVRFDPVTDWVLMAWDAFRAERFPADEARKLAIALGLEVEADLVRGRVVGKSGDDVVLLEPKARRGRGRVDPEADRFATWLDAVHTAMLVYEEDGAAACEQFLKRTGLLTDSTFRACLQAMLNAVPRARAKGRFLRPEMEVLERMRLAFFPDLEVPEETEPPPKMEQMRMM
jgi:putative DNA methylase